MQINVVGEHGHVWYTDADGWGHILEGSAAHRAETSFSRDQTRAQGAFTQAVVDWLADPGRPHGNRLETALLAFEVTMAVVDSAVAGRRVDFVPSRIGDMMSDLRVALEAREGVHPERLDWSSYPTDD
jgi:hypothetical protein